MDRRSLLDDDLISTHEQEHERADVFGDEYEVEDWDMGVADGFRPNAGRDSEEAEGRQDATEEEDQPPVRTVSAHYAPSHPLGSSTVSRNSIRKSGSHADPFASPEDADTEPRNSLEFEPETNFAHRTLSSSSSRVYAQTSSPRFGAGPSHPYGMYTQTAVPRSPSTVTGAATRQPSVRQSFAQNVPQHPYAMYPQAVDLDDVDDDDDDVDQSRPNPVPLGFNGLGQSYTRRLGPDGEDQGIIDAVGHSEQLPPYSRYPEDGPEKMPLLPPTLHSRAPVAGTDPSMPLMHTTIIPTPAPVPQSMTDESAMPSHSAAPSLRRMLSTSSGTTNSAEKKSLYEKTWKEKTWREKRWTRFWGIPFWMLMTALAIFVFIAALLGGVIGGFVAGGQSATSKAATTTIVTSLYDASLMPSPTSGGPPLGTFALDLGDAQEVASECLVDQNMVSAWACNLAPNSKMGISVVASSDPDQGTGATLFYNSDDTSVAAGAQLSYMGVEFSPFLTVSDNDDKDLGLAFYFQSFYDKVVVVPQANMTFGPAARRRTRRGYNGPPFQVPDAWKTKKQMLSPGDRPWFCVWNDTLVEGFIYINEKASTSTSSSSSSVITPPPSSQISPGSSSQATPDSASGTTAVGATSATATASTDIITTTISNAFTSAVYTGPASGFSLWASGKAMKAAAHREAWFDLDQFIHKEKRQQPARYMDMPYVVKIEERRLPQSPQPYCQQYQILDNGNANIALDQNGDPIIFFLNEQDPSQAPVAEATATITLPPAKRSAPLPNSCHCQWMSGLDSDGDTDGD